MITVLVTGGAGFIGSCFVRHLLSHPDHRHRYHVVVLDKLTYAGSLENLTEVRGSEQFVFQRGDIGDKTLVRNLLDQYAPQWVVNFAAESHVDRSIDHPTQFAQTNVMGTCCLLEGCADYFPSLSSTAQATFRFLQVSTDEVFGSLGSDGFFGPESPYAPRSPYAASKAAADHFARAFFHTYSLPVLITNCSNNYGPYQFPEKLLPRMIRRALAGQTLPVYGDGSNVRDWIHVEDHVRGLVRALIDGIPGRDYLFGGDCERSNLQLVQLLCEYLDELSPSPEGSSYANRIEFVADRPGHDQRYAIDCRQTKQQLRWQPEIAVEDGLRGTVKWYSEHGDWIERVTKGRYDGGRLGLR